MESLALFLRLNVAQGDASEHTITGYMIHIRQFYGWCVEGGLQPGRANEFDLARYRRHLVTQGYKRSTITVKLSAVRRFFQAAIWRGLRDDNPAAGLKAPREHTTRRDQVLARYLSPEEISELLSVPDRSTQAGIRDWAMIGVMYFHGLRVSEVANLELLDVKMDAKQIHVRSGKGGKDRVLPMIETTHNMLWSWLKVRHQICSKKTGNAFFLSLSQRNLGGPISVNGIRDRVNHALAMAGLKRPGISCHALRHAHASHFVAAGGEIVVLSQEMGHASIETTSIYTHVANAIKSNPAAKLEEQQTKKETSPR